MPRTGSPYPQAFREQLVALHRAGRGLVRSERHDVLEVFEFMTVNETDFPVETTARAMGAPRGGFHAWSRREPSPAPRDLADRELPAKTRRVHAASKESCGPPRIHAGLASEGVLVGRKRIERLMKADGSAGVSRRRGTRATVRNGRVRPACDLVDPNVCAERPDQLRVADPTCVPTRAGVLDLAVVLDAFSRRVVGWAMGTNLRTRLVLDALDMAVGQRRPRSGIHHSDQGSQSTSVAFGARCKEAGVRPSTGSVGGAYENALCESFSATHESAPLDRRKVATKAEARMAVFEFVEGRYNPGRRHSALGSFSPIDHERRAIDALENQSH